MSRNAEMQAITAWINGHRACGQCRHGLLQEQKLVCVLLETSTLKESCCSKFQPGDSA